MFRAVAATVVPEASNLDGEGWAELEALVAGSLRERPEALRRRIRLFLLFVEWAPLLRHGRRFTALEPRLRERILSKLQDHPVSLIRMGLWGLRTLAFLGYYGRSAAAEAIGYRPDPRGWEARR